LNVISAVAAAAAAASAAASATKRESTKETRQRLRIGYKQHQQQRIISQNAKLILWVNSLPLSLYTVYNSSSYLSYSRERCKLSVSKHILKYGDI